ncbi:hypothetical protein [Haloactinomyces albus]|uniref:Uncharacterized protein n=1 Tax=Haloactinomyces albus TaxID=1352928 RepID=A0AAE4CP79_9ACTN|nr:hypothetical protein [Haloactinomyces albus]MDR7301423.1 hypothetical protein [Haloactinomyces albus]
MGQYEFIFVIDALSGETVHRIYEDYDATYSQHGGTCLLTVASEGETAFQAAKLLVVDMEQRFGTVFHRTYEDLVTKADIADRIDSTVQAVGQWTRGERYKNTPFPSPFNHVAGGVWLWSEVNAWLREVGKDYDDDVSYPSRRELADIDRWLANGNFGNRHPCVHSTETVKASGSLATFATAASSHVNVGKGNYPAPPKWGRSDYAVAG